MSAHQQSHLTRSRSRGLVPRVAVVAALVAGSALALAAGQTATAQVSPAGVPLATAAGYSVLGATTVTNTGASVIDRSVGLHPGTAITGFPPGIVEPPATIQAANAVTLQAQNDLTTAYLDAAARPSSASVSADLGGGQTLVAGVYTGGALQVTGALTLDGEDNPDAVFVFQAASTLTTASASSIDFVRGANPCNVFWQVGSSAILGTGSVFVGTILALTSVTVQTDVVVHGRALARNGAVTLDTDVFRPLACDSSAPATTTTTTTTPAAETTVAAGVTVPAVPVATDSVDVDRDTPTTSFVFTPTDVTLPATGTGLLVTQSGVGLAVLLIGLTALVVARRRQPA